MKKKMQITLLLLLTIILLCLGGCGKQTPNDHEEDGSGWDSGQDENPLNPVEISAEITDFTYQYYNGFGMCGYQYVLEKTEDGGAHLTYSSDQYYMYGEMEKEVDPSLLEEVQKLCEEKQVGEWNGFNRNETDVTDGDGFRLSIEMADENRISANGSNAYPKGFQDFVKPLDEIFAPYVKELCEEKRQEQIAQGINGKLDFFMVNFNEQGSSGRDHYDFMVKSHSDGDHNVNINIDVLKDDYLPAGKYLYACEVKDDQLPFDAVQELIEKYDLIQWYNYNETAEDYQNSEWFQLSFGFDDDFYLDACGTEHPENYDEFRKEFLTLMTNWIKEGEQAGFIRKYE